jgi:hypothetical protein
MVKYHRATTLLTLGRADEALQELERLKKIAPREPSVYFLLGEVYTHVSLLTAWRCPHHLDPRRFLPFYCFGLGFMFGWCRRASQSWLSWLSLGAWAWTPKGALG